MQKSCLQQLLPAAERHTWCMLHRRNLPALQPGHALPGCHVICSLQLPPFMYMCSTPSLLVLPHHEAGHQAPP